MVFRCLEPCWLLAKLQNDLNDSYIAGIITSSHPEFGWIMDSVYRYLALDQGGLKMWSIVLDLITFEQAALVVPVDHGPVVVSLGRPY